MGYWYSLKFLSDPMSPGAAPSPDISPRGEGGSEGATGSDDVSNPHDGVQPDHFDSDKPRKVIMIKFGY